MSSSVLEVQRAAQVQHALYAKTLVDLLVNTPQQAVSTHRERLDHAQRCAFLREGIVDAAQSLSDAYQDATHVREQEMATLSGQGELSAALTEFYDRLVKVKDWHRRHPTTAEASTSEEQAIDWTGLEGVEGTQGWLDRLFSGEEALGRYLDLHAHHAAYLNLPGATRIPYLAYLDEVDQFDKLPRASKLQGERYRHYLDALLAYLEGFLRRAHPLFDTDDMQALSRKLFDERWAKGKVSLWQDAAAQEPGIWCPACQKMYSKETVYQAHLTSKKHLKAAAGQNGAPEQSAAPPPQANGAARTSTETREYRLAALEDQVANLLAELSSPLLAVRAETKSNTERKAALTDKERALEIEELERREAADAARAAREALGAAGRRDQYALRADDDDEGERIYNPLKLPLGWDGKPIPFWLYKLHGLGVEYACEICSGATYPGRKNFERHFTEARHTYGMKALGLPNTKHFAEITRIEDAIALAEKLKQEGKQEIFRAEEMEELEDAEGNVYNKKVYTDLKTQGLI